MGAQSAPKLHRRVQSPVATTSILNIYPPSTPTPQMSKNKHRQSINDYYKEERTEILQELVKVEKKRTDTLEGVIRITSGRTFPGLAPKREAFMLKTNNKFDDQIDCMHKRLKELNEFISNKDVRQHGGNKRRRTKQPSNLNQIQK